MAKRTPKDKIEITRKIAEKYATGDYTIESCAESEGVTSRQLYNWEAEISEISELMKKSRESAARAHKQTLKNVALNALGRMINGFHEEEEVKDVVPTYDEDGNEIAVQVKSLKKIKKYIPPNVTAIIFALKSLDPENFRDPVPQLNQEPQKFIIGGKEITF